MLWGYVQLENSVARSPTTPSFGYDVVHHLAIRGTTTCGVSSTNGTGRKSSCALGNVGCKGHCVISSRGWRFIPTNKFVSCVLAEVELQATSAETEG